MWYVRICICVYIYVCVYVYSEILVLKKKEFCDNMNEPWHYAKLKKKKNTSHGMTSPAWFHLY